jgi:hypothetical protein
VEHGVVAEIVGHGRQDRGVGGEGNGGPGGAFLEVAPHELRREVLRIRGGTAVAEGEHLAAGTQGIGDATADREYETGVGLEIAPLQVCFGRGGTDAGFIHAANYDS